MGSKIFFGIFLLFISSSVVFGQTKPQAGFTKHEKLSLTASLGLTTYYGDLCDAFDCMKFRPNFGIGMWYRFTNHISNKTEINYFRLYAQDHWKERNLDFRSGNAEIYTSVLLDIFPYSKHFRKRRFISPYVYGGIGVAYFNPKGKDTDGSGKWVALRPLQTEGVAYGPVTMILPFGLGVRIKYQKNLDFIIEGGYRITFTDRLDDVSGPKYKDVNTFNGNDVAKRLSMKSPTDPNLPDSYSHTYLYQKRGNSKANDGYIIFNVKARYVLGTSSVHFKGKHPLLKPSHN